MPVAVIAEIGARSLIVGTKPLYAIRHGIVAAGRSLYRNGATIVIIFVVALCYYSVNIQT